MRSYGIMVGLALVMMMGLGCVQQPLPIHSTDGLITERVLITSTQDGYHLTFSKPTGEVTRRIWCDGFDARCIEGK